MEHNDDEYILDTSPSDSNSFFRIVEINQPSNTFIVYTSTNTRYYLALATTNLVSGLDWTNFYPLTVQGSSNTTTAEDSRIAPSRNYRVKVQLAP